MTKRLFFGIAFPDAAARALADAAARALADCRARIAPAGNLHVTVRFLGDVEEARITALSDAVRAAVAAVPSFALRPDALRFGPPGRQPRMLWAEFMPLPEFDALCGAVRAASDAAVPGLTEAHPPTLHATLARFAAADCPRFPRLPELPPMASLRATACVLFESRLSPAGPTYVGLASFPLAAVLVGYRGQSPGDKSSLTG